MARQPVDGEDKALQVQEVLQQRIGGIGERPLFHGLDLVLQFLGQHFIVREQLVDEDRQQKGGVELQQCRVLRRARQHPFRKREGRLWALTR